MRSIHHLAEEELVKIKFFDLISVRFPWLLIGLGGGLVASILVSRFELSLRENIALAFFIPVVAYMSDAIGTQTETILIRALTNLHFNHTKYIFRELIVGAILGLLMGILTTIFAYFLSASLLVATVVGLSLLLSMTVATGLACLAPFILKSMGRDPAVASGPLTTALQDIVSLAIYFLVASLIL